MRLERLLLLQRRRSQEHEDAFKERLRTEAKRNDILASIALASRDSLDLEEVLGAATSLLGTRFAANSVEIWFLNEDATVVHGLHGLAAGRRRLVPRRVRAAAARQRAVPRARRPRASRTSSPTGTSSIRTSLAFAALEALGATSLVGIPIHREGETHGRPRHVVGRAARLPARRARLLRARRRPARARDPRRAPLREPAEPARGARARAAAPRARRPRPRAG